jgi:hypothetical protein
MAVTISPEYPVAGETVTLSMTSASGDKKVFSLSSVPPASSVATGLLHDPLKANLIYFLDAEDFNFGGAETAEWGAQSDSFVPDEPGEYTIVGYDVLDIVGIPQFNRDPAGERRFKLLAQQSTTIHIGDYTYLLIAVQVGDSIKLRLQVNDDTIRGAEFVDWSTERARVASTDADVVTALDNLVGETISSAGTGLQSGANDLLSNYEAHIAEGATIHNIADSTNGVDDTEAYSDESAISLLNAIRYHMYNHLSDGGDTWHDANDSKNVPLIGTVSNVAGATVLSADLRERVYERHRVQIATPAVHDNPDNTNTLAAPSLLDTVIVEYLDAFAETNPTPPAGEAEGLLDAEHLYGFTTE